MGGVGEFKKLLRIEHIVTKKFISQSTRQFCSSKNMLRTVSVSTGPDWTSRASLNDGVTLSFAVSFSSGSLVVVIVSRFSTDCGCSGVVATVTVTAATCIGTDASRVWTMTGSSETGFFLPPPKRRISPLGLVLALPLLSLSLLSSSSSGAADDDVDWTEMRGILSLFCFFVLFRFLIFNGLSGDGTAGGSSDALSCRPDALETFPRLTQQQQRRITINLTAILAQHDWDV